MSIGASTRARVGRGGGGGSLLAGVRVPETVLGVLLVAGSALGGLVWYRSATAPQTVVVAAGDLPRGHVLTAADLRAATVSGAEGITLVAGDEARGLIGQAVRVDLAAGAPLTPAVVAETAPLDPGEALVATAVGPGEYPPSLAAGDRVRVVVIADAAEDDTGVASIAVADEVAEVWELDEPTDVDPHAVATLRVPLDLATRIAGAASVRLIQVEG
jgi:Flp pilus assembly protein CpaB